MRLIGLAVALSVSLFAVPLAAEAQPAGKVPRIGYLGASSASLEPELLGAFQQGLRELGWIEGQTIAIEYRLLTMYPYREFADSGGLMSYAPSYAALFRRAATYVDKILKGADTTAQRASVNG